MRQRETRTSWSVRRGVATEPRLARGGLGDEEYLCQPRGLLDDPAIADGTRIADSVLPGPARSALYGSEIAILRDLWRWQNKPITSDT